MLIFLIRRVTPECALKKCPLSGGGAICEGRATWGGRHALLSQLYISILGTDQMRSRSVLAPVWITNFSRFGVFRSSSPVVCRARACTESLNYRETVAVIDVPVPILLSTRTRDQGGGPWPITKFGSQTLYCCESAQDWLGRQD